MLVGKNPLAQKAPLHMLMVLALEIVTTFDPDLITRLVCGYIIFLCVGRLRASDGSRVVAVSSDILVAGTSGANRLSGGYVEAEALATKTATTADRKRRLLPIVAPALGLSHLD